MVRSRIVTFLFYGYLTLIPLSSFLSVRLSILILLLSLFTTHDKSLKDYVRNAWDLLAYLVVLVAGLFYSEDVATGLRMLETSFPILASPIIFFRLFKNDRQEIMRSFLFFSFGVLVASITCAVNACLVYYSTHDPQVFLFDQLTDIIHSHPTYLAYFLIASITHGLYLLYYEEIKVSPLVWLPILLFFMVILILTGGRTAYVGLLLTFSFFILKYILEPGGRTKRIVFTAVSVLLVGLFFSSSLDYLKEGIATTNDYWERSELWKSAIKANPSPVLGVGTGDYKTELNQYYLAHGMEEFARESYNSHNQFIQTYFSNGLLGLLVLLVMMARPLYLSVRSQNALGILLFFPFAIYGVTEVFLGRYQGVVFFSILHQLVMTLNYSTLESPSLKRT